MRAQIDVYLDVVALVRILRLSVRLQLYLLPCCAFAQYVPNVHIYTNIS